MGKNRFAAIIIQTILGDMKSVDNWRCTHVLTLIDRLVNGMASPVLKTTSCDYPLRQSTLKKYYTYGHSQSSRFLLYYNRFDKDFRLQVNYAYSCFCCYVRSLPRS